ncbi:helix-turn-helix domain-containing protein [Nonomuraea deserti]|uniref:Helix-turn-helix domain-containing protein n=1 Tax=Nonomuraea deserti TaxID=1848322 RepID=A0A4R4V9M5_9ACTN|nr:tetratricopeptide repeat protein [Nonomuraea deserti]TDD02068.1 helix-turn-helix domain-containing protein [Nonomuraea deserti]
MGTLLRVWRERALLTQRQLADLAGLHERTVRRLEAGTLRRPHLSSLRLLAGALDLDAAELSALIREAGPDPQRPRETPVWVVPRQLPPDVAAFVGRTRELASLDEVRNEGTALITAIDGMGGVGKTALAVRWAHRVADRFPDGQLYINLQGYAPGPPLPATQALARLLRGLGIPADQVPAEVEEATGLYRSLLADKRVLVLLDNAHSAEQIRPLLPGGSECMAVVTSRDRLTGLAATHGVHRLTLGLLDPDEAAALLRHTIGHERGAAEPEPVTALARMCGYLPLAMRIAAANLAGRPDRSIAQYLAELQDEDPLDALTVAHDPHVAVRVAFDHSYHRLAPDRQRLYRLLGLVPGPDVGVAGAAALAGIEVADARGALAELVEAHLAQPQARDRYGMHDLLKAYARGRAYLHDGEEACEAALERLLDWYVAGADAAAALLFPEAMRLPLPPGAATPASTAFAGLPEAAAWLVDELPNLVAASRYAAGHGPHPAAWRMADALREYFWQRRPMVEWQLIAQAGLDAATTAGDARAQVTGHLSLGQAERAAGRPRSARLHLAEALTLARQVGWTEGQAAALSCQGTVALLSGDLRQAADDLTQAVRLYRHSGWLGGQADSLLDLSLVERELGELYEAVVHLHQALDLYRQTGSRVAETIVLGALGEVDHDRGRLESAHRHLTDAARLYQELGARFGEAYFLRSLAAIKCDTGDIQEALTTAREALRLAGEIRDPYTEARTRIVLARVHLRLGHTRDAADQYGRALALAQQTCSPTTEAGARLGLADVSLALDQPDRALGSARDALGIAAAAGMRILQGYAHITLAAAHHRLGHLDPALSHAQQALDLHRQSGCSLGAARALRVLGCALRDTGDLPAAERRWQEALDRLADIGSPEADEIRALLNT